MRPVILSLSLLLLTLIGCSKPGGSGEKSGADSSTKGKQEGGKGSQGAQDSGKGGKSGDAGAQISDVVMISTDDQRRAGIQVAAVEVRSEPQQLVVAGQVAMDELHTAHIGTIADGPITTVNVLPGDLVRRGAVLAEQHSHSVHETVGALLQAFAAVDRARGSVTFAQQARDRYQHLYGIRAASLEEAQRSDQGVLEANRELADAEANVHMEREHLSELLQVNPETLTPDTLYQRELIPVRAVQAGTVIARNVTPGTVASLGQEAFIISNLTTVWVTASVNEKDLALVRVGERAGITSQALDTQVLSGRVGMLGDTIDPVTRTVPVRIVVPNPHTRLRPGMFATAMIDEAATRTAIFAATDALQDINGNQVVFVTADGTHFRTQTVKLGTRSAGKVEILDGLHPGDHVVVNGAFMVKSELLKGTMGEG